MYNIAITGAGSGLGFAFRQHFAADPNNVLHAIDISFPESETYHAPESAQITEHTVDVSVEGSIAALTHALNSQPLDLLIHSAGVRGLTASILEKEKNPEPAEALNAIDAQTMLKTLEINTLGSFLLIRALLQNLKAAKQAKVIVIGSRMGSIASTSVGGGYAYRASKAGLNAIVKSFSVDVPEVVFTVIHPGRVASNLVTGVREERAVEAHEVVNTLMKFIPKLDEQDSGKFYDKEKKEIPW